MKKMNFTSQLLRLSSLMVLFVTLAANLSAQCIEKVTVFLDPNTCSYTLQVSDVRTDGVGPLKIRKLTTAGAQDYVDSYPYGSGTGTIVFSTADIAKEFEIMSGTGAQMCFHYVTVADISAPILPAIAPSFLKCTDLVNGKIPGPAVLGSWKGASGKGQVLNPLAKQTWTATDCSNFTQAWSDDYSNVTCVIGGCDYQTVTRRWVIKDIYGNTSTTDQVIFVERPKIVIPGNLVAGNFVLDIFNCSADPSTVGLPLVDYCNAALADETAVLGKDYCGRSVLKLSEMKMNACPGSYMITRTYKIYECDGSFTTATQVINVWDRTTPKVSFKFNDYLRVKEPMCYVLNGMVMTEYVYKTVVTPIDLTMGDVQGNALAANVSEHSIKITPLVNSISCNTANISLDYTVADPNCSNGKISLYSDNGAILFNGMNNMTAASGTTVKITGTFTNIPGLPDPVVHIFAKDECGNITDVKVTIVIYDNVSPTSICEDKQVSLTNNGSAVAFPFTFSLMSYDNCCTPALLPIAPAVFCTRQYIRRTGTECWYDAVQFTCDDANVKVDIRTVDGCGNYTDCCVTANIVDKNKPACTSYMDVTTECTDTKLANVESFFTEPASFTTCGKLTVTSTTTPLSLVCGAGTVTKTWTFTDAAGNKAVCSQKLTVTSVFGYRVKPLANQTLTCSGYVYDEAKEKAAALANVKMLNAAGKTTCSAPVVEVEKWEYSNSQYCKIIRIRYTFVDKCGTYCTLVPNVDNFINWDNTANTAGYIKDADGFYQADERLGTIKCIGGRLLGFERYIYINDKTAPTSVPPVIADACLGDNCTFAFPGITLTGSDKCDDGSVTSSNLAFSWKLIGTDKSGTTAVIPAISGLKAGTYTIEYTVSDFCGNINYYSFKFKGSDCKTPFILVHEKNLELGYDSGLKMGMGTACVDDMLNNLGDNCTGYDYLYSKTRLQRASDAAVYSEALPTCLTFTCADKGVRVPIRVWTRDEAGNTNFVLNYITVQDNNGACAGALAAIKGSVSTENNQAVSNVSVSAASSSATTAAGAFEVNAVIGSNVQVKAVKLSTEDKYAGVTTFDIARISKHLLDIEKFTSPYSMIAADVNKDGEIDGSDMLHIRNFILRKTTSLPGGVWRFIDKSYSFKNASNPFGEDFPEVVNLTNVPATATANFTAVKLGDVNTTYTAALAAVSVRSSKSLVLQAEDMMVKAGNEYTVNITADNFDASAFQGTFSFAGATVKAVKAGDLANFNDGNFGVFANEVTTSWNGNGKLNANVMTITFVANKSGKLSEMLTVGSSLTPAVANDAQGTEMNVNLKFTTGKVSGSEFALYQNTPNPVSVETKIGFNLPSESTAKLTIYNVEGKVMMVKNGAYKAGYNEISVNKAELNANGVMYYRLETPEHTATKKMIIIE